MVQRIENWPDLKPYLIVNQRNHPCSFHIQRFMMKYYVGEDGSENDDDEEDEEDQDNEGKRTQWIIRCFLVNFVLIGPIQMCKSKMFKLPCLRDVSSKDCIYILYKCKFQRE